MKSILWHSCQYSTKQSTASTDHKHTLPTHWDSHHPLDTPDQQPLQAWPPQPGWKLPPALSGILELLQSIFSNFQENFMHHHGVKMHVA